VSSPLADRVAEIPVIAMPVWKRGIDIVVATVGLVILSPLFLVVAIAVALDSPGGPFFRQTRVGYGGGIFTCWKFRSMTRGADSLKAQLIHQNDASGRIFKIKDDPRCTRVGRVLRKSSLDELPQLLNVLRGEMSLVGPRPPLLSEVMEYEPAEMRRLATVPGITGLWQVTLRGRHNFADMVELDLRYADEISFRLDLQILLKTIPAVLFGRGAC
jgi:lipopolysaccharide/colanic/teichoic acid biosynthesis glycosyltransferase